MRKIISLFMFYLIVSLGSSIYGQDKCSVPHVCGEEMVLNLLKEWEAAKQSNDHNKMKASYDKLEECYVLGNKSRKVNTRSKLRLVLTSDKKIYKVGEPIRITKTWKNIAGQDISVWVNDFFFDNGLDVRDEKRNFIGPPHQCYEPDYISSSQEPYYSEFPASDRVTGPRVFLMSGKVYQTIETLSTDAGVPIGLNPGRYFITLGFSLGGHQGLESGECYSEPVNTIEIEVMP